MNGKPILKCHHNSKYYGVCPKKYVPKFNNNNNNRKRKGPHNNNKDNKKQRHENKNDN